MKICCPYENVSCLLFVAFSPKEVVLFSSFRQFKPIAVPRSVILQQVQTLRVHTNNWAVACSVQQRVHAIYFSGEIAIAMQPARATRTRRSRMQARDLSSTHAPLFGLRGCLIFLVRVHVACTVKVLYSTAATAQLVVHTKTESGGFVGNLIRQRHPHCRILSQNVQLSTNDRAFARRVSSVTSTT